jgi:hypothetical protein
VPLPLRRFLDDIAAALRNWDSHIRVATQQGRYGNQNATPLGRMLQRTLPRWQVNGLAAAVGAAITRSEMMRAYLTRGIALMTLVATAPATAVVDPAGDFLPTHAGPSLASVDIREASVLGFSGSFVFYSAMNGLIGDAGTSYVWGIDRGAGTAGLFAGTPPIGPGVTFDAVVVVRPDGSGSVTALNEIGAPTVTDILGATFVGETEIITFVDFGLLPSRGFALGDYRFNLWTRTGGGNIGIADLAQGDGTFGAVPEPVSWAMLVIGFGLIGGAARRRHDQATGQREVAR